jgi:hypothetical protein
LAACAAFRGLPSLAPAAFFDDSAAFACNAGNVRDPTGVREARGRRESKRITVLETKGDQLDNLDTEYKRELLKVLSDSFTWDTSVPAGTLELVKSTGETVEGALILDERLAIKVAQPSDVSKRTRSANQA